jgi:hypothetical protein
MQPASSSSVGRGSRSGERTESGCRSLWVFWRTTSPTPATALMGVGMSVCSRRVMATWCTVRWSAVEREQSRHLHYEPCYVAQLMQVPVDPTGTCFVNAPAVCARACMGGKTGALVTGPLGLSRV